MKKLQFQGNEEEKHLFNLKIIQRFLKNYLDETFSTEARVHRASLDGTLANQDF